MHPRHAIGTLLIAFCALSGCSPSGPPGDAPAAVTYDRTTAEELRSRRGSPDSVTRIPAPAAAPVEVWSYQGGERRFHVQGGVVVASTRPPTPGAEQRLQHWRQLWRGQAKTYAPVAGSHDGHGHRLWQLSRTGSGAAVIYDRASDQVIEVMEYGP